MDLERIAGAPGVDEQSVEAEIDEYLGGDRSGSREPWSITSLGAADWAMRRYSDALALVQRYDDEIFLWNKAKERIGGAASWFEDRLREWAISERTDKRKSFPLAHGTVSTRTVPAKARVDDEAVVLEWARTACPDAVDVVPAHERFLISKSTAAVVHVVVAWEAIDKTTGEVQRIDVDPPIADGRERLERLRERMPTFTVEAVYDLAVVDGATGLVVPGMSVVPASTSASVKPLGL